MAVDKLNEASAKVAEAAALVRIAAAELLSNTALKPQLGRDCLNRHLSLIAAAKELTEDAKQLDELLKPTPAKS